MCLTLLRRQIINGIFHAYRHQCRQIQIVEASLRQRGIDRLLLDHFAVIDLPGPHTGIPWLSKIFSTIGYVPRGHDYLPDKQNDFHWMAESSCEQVDAREALPQVVVADFRLEEMPPEIRVIIEKYSAQAAPASLDTLAALVGHAQSGNSAAAQRLSQLIVSYLKGRDWPLPTKKEFRAVRSFNELLAWVLIFGRKPNHFTLSVHLLDRFADLTAFNQFLEQSTSLKLNHEGGVIKGSRRAGIEQSSTAGTKVSLELADGIIEVPGDFVEFVWRHPLSTLDEPILWKDFYPDFIGQNASHVIESLYLAR